MRRSEALVLFLFIATAVLFFATRVKPDGSLATPLQAVATVAAAPGVTATAAAKSAALRPPATPVPVPAATPAPAFFSSSWLQAHPAGDVPPITAQGAIVLDRDTQQIMFAKNMDARRPPASIMKIVTAMVTLDLAKPSQVIDVSRDAANMEPNRMGLTYGEQVSVGDVLYGLLLDSGNDAAEALADSLPGGRAVFLQKMNDKAASLGLKNTHFVDPAGLDDANYTTPYDMAVLADTALTGYPTIRTVVSTKDIAIPGNASHKWFRPTNLNDLLWDYPGTYGMKVGYTDAADYTIVLAGQKNGHNVIIVLLGSDHHFTEGRKLFDWAYAHIPTPDNTPVRKFAVDVEKS
ncbi:MAG TPA: D-alanyl-D-alanine carboxypeptidase family protein [Chloroflexota bacterium]|nr:D-alanyl-D-alanine carboxypeptidase family protein [Chloroflexota bacterium]